MSYKHRVDAKTDKTQKYLVSFLLEFPNIYVETGHDDLLVGYRYPRDGWTDVQRLIWVEWKSKEALSKVTGAVLESSKKDSQKKLEQSGFPCYLITGKVSDIFKMMGYPVTNIDNVDVMFEQHVESRECQ